ncbi:MAG: 30S ribosomal protein S11 [Candidatus Roizmanbacteria bacterium GW2011_GWC2_37_13]|uniref:Small ribosomal subunit protein uS11 n=1 Tax=Candidatus Roizmanbacteria bacterium GW2011_GWC2_37_13 TaxID=1618486 RepID=A0A0G0G6A6_9BACT|nr:MAG: 30S ribosomal protein S11, small subunit ribosomal protein S11 [Candidatus Roizmanbacteria bacterium GW2011_GWC1_37_12]KKQ26618.1 MAG: 30S ribosomal protein S11 [Candidatus Roizmanbacteria bacterium GW2011_GWC2_37_13]
MAKKPTKKFVEKGRIYITATFNNTMVTITTENGDPIVVGSCGMHGFSGTRKSTPYAATTTTEAALRKAIENFNFQSADIFIKGIGPGREASLRAVKASKIEINRIVDITPIPHNGIRPPKIRRV